MNNILKTGETMEDVVRRLKESFDAVQNIVPIAYWYENLNENGRVKDIHFSDAMRGMLGYKSKREFPDKLDTLMKLTHPDDVQIMLDNAIATGTGKIGKYDVQYRIRKADGSYLWCNATGQVVKDSNGATVGMYGAFIDISDKMALEQERISQIENEAARHELLNEVIADDGVFIIDCANDTRKTVHDRLSGAKNYNDSETYSSAFARYVDTFVCEPDQEMMRRFVNPANIPEILGDRKELKIQYRDITTGTQRFYQMRIVRFSDTEVLQSFRENDAEMVNDLLFRKLKENYYAIFGVDLESGLMRSYKDDPLHVAGEEGEITSFSSTMLNLASHFEGEARDFFERNSNTQYIREKFAEQDWAEYIHRSPFDDRKWADATGIVLSRNADGVPSLFCLAFNYLDEEAGKVQDMQEQLQEEALRRKLVYEISDSSEWSYEISADDKVISAHYADSLVSKATSKQNENPMAWLDYLHPDDKERVLASFMAAIHDRSGKTAYNENFRYLGKDCKYRWLKSAGRVLRRPDGTGEFIGLLSDITKQVDEQEELRRIDSLVKTFASEYEAVFIASIGDGSYRTVTNITEISDIFDGKGTFTDALERYTKEMIHPLDRERAASERIKTEKTGEGIPVGKSHTVEFRSRTEDGYVWYRGTMSRISEDMLLVGFKNCDAEKLFKTIEDTIIGEFDALYMVNLNTDEIRPVRASRVSKVGAIKEKSTYTQLCRKFAETVAPQYREDWFRFSDISYLKQYMADLDRREYIYELPEAGNAMRRFTVNVTERANGEAVQLLLSFTSIDDVRTQAILLHRKMAEEQRRFDMLHEIIHSGKWSFTVGPDDRITSAHYSDEVQKIIGNDLTNEGYAWIELVHPDDREAASEAFNATIKDHAGNTPFDVNYRMADRNGVYHWFHSAGRIIRKDDGTGEFFGIHIDITEQIEQERERVAAANDQILSDVTQALYSFNLTVDLEKGSFRLITGTGGETAIEIMMKARNYREVYEKMMARIRPEYHDRIRELMSLDYLLMNCGHTGYFRTEEYQTTGDDETSLWGEINVTFGKDSEGRPVANLLGRDITAARREQALQEREIKVVQAKNEILSGVTKTLYGFNLTVNLADNSYTLITGTGSEDICAMLDAGLDRPYTEGVDKFIALVPEQYRKMAIRAIGRDVLLGQRHRHGHLGTWTIPWKGQDGKLHWIESNTFMGENEKGEPIANLLGRNVTEQVEEDTKREMERAAANAKDRILSEITQELYGYNLTVNLRTLKYSVITGTGMDAACEVFNKSDDYAEAIRLKLDFVAPNDRERIARLMEPEALKKMVSDGVNGAIGATVYEANVNGDHQWHETNIFIGTDSNGDPIANILGRNITEQHNEQERREREARAAAVKDQILAGITQSLYGYNVTVNLDTMECSVIRGTGMDCIVDAIERTRSFDTILKEFEKRIPAEQLPNALALLSPETMRAKVKSGMSGFVGSVEHESDCPIHGRHWHEVNLFLGTDENGHPIANILARDVTEQHNAQEQQEREREAASAKDRILSEITQSLYGYNLTVNLRTLKYSVITGTGMDAACEVFKKSDDYAEAIRLKLEFVAPNDRERIAKLMEPDALRKVAEEGSSGALATAVYEANVNGEHQWHETNVFIGMDANGDPIANILGRNITEQRTRADAETQLLAAQEANKAKTAFLFNMSHDIRTPMNAIRGFTDIAMKNIDDHERLKDCLEKIDNSGNLLLSLINSVLDMSRVESGKAKVEEIESDVMESFQGVMTTMGELAKAKGISLAFEFGQIEDRYVYADQERCNRIFVNIISNSIKYSKPNGWVKVRCEQAGEKNDGHAWYRYVFEDNGIGMSEEFLGHVFEEFSREKNSTTSGIQGTGLGMSLCKSFVELMGGTIACRSKQGVGTTFEVELPFRVREDIVPAEDDAGKHDDAQPSASIFAVRRILLVEDNELNREVAQFVLEEQGLVIESVEDGSIAVRTVREKGLEYYDFILMDIQMPIMGGYEATRVIRNLGFKRPIIALSANAFAEDKQKSLEAGMDDHVAKPIKIKELFTALARFL